MSSARLRAVIVDDERLAREELRSMLAEHPHVEIVGEAASATAAEALIGSAAPDVVFLDIQMPGRSGFDLLERVGGDFRTVFVTAFDAYAIRAFEVNALDYLLKPVSPDRLARALERVAAAGAPGAAAPQPARRLEYGDPVFVVADGRPKLLKVGAVACIAGAGDYSEVFTSDGRKHFVLKGLKEWEERLPEQHFARIHKSTIVNLEYVEELEEWFNRSFRVVVRGMAEPLVMSRRYAARLRERFG